MDEYRTSSGNTAYYKLYGTRIRRDQPTINRTKNCVYQAVWENSPIESDMAELVAHLRTYHHERCIVQSTYHTDKRAQQTADDEKDKFLRDGYLGLLKKIKDWLS